MEPKDYSNIEIMYNILGNEVVGLNQEFLGIDDGNKEYIADKGKIKELTRDKILSGNLAKFKSKNNAIVNSILNAASVIKGQRANLEGDDKKLTKRIISKAKKKFNSSDNSKRELGTKLQEYGAKLAGVIQKHQEQLPIDEYKFHCEKKATYPKGTDRGGSLDSEQLKSKMKDDIQNFVKSQTLSNDIDRYLSTGRIHLFDSDGNEIPIDFYNENDFKETFLNLLEVLMEKLEMGEKGEDEKYHLNTAAQSIFDKFNRFDGQSPDQLRGAVEEIINDLSTSEDPKENQLSFLLKGMHQNNLVTPGGNIGVIGVASAREGRYMGRATSEVRDQNRFNITIDPAKELKVEAKSVLINRDADLVGKEYETHFTTNLTYDSRKEDPIEIDYKLDVKIPKNDLKNDETHGMVGNLLYLGFNPDIELVENLV